MASAPIYSLYDAMGVLRCRSADPEVCRAYVNLFGMGPDAFCLSEERDGWDSPPAGAASSS